MEPHLARNVISGGGTFQATSTARHSRVQSFSNRDWASTNTNNLDIDLLHQTIQAKCLRRLALKRYVEKGSRRKLPTNSCSLQRAQRRRVSSTSTMTMTLRLSRPKIVPNHRPQPQNRPSPVCASMKRPPRFLPRSPRDQSTPKCRRRTR